MFDIVISYASIWAPSLVAILGMVTTILIAIGKTKEAFSALKKDETLKDVREELMEANQKNTELVESQKLLLDEITKIKNYYENVKRGD